MISSILRAGLVVLALAAAPLVAFAADPAEIKKAAQQMGEAFFKGDYAAQAALMPEKLIELMGGREKAIEVMKSTAAMMESKGLKVEKYEVGDVSQIAEASGDTFALLPTTFVMKAPNARFTEHGHVLAIGNGGGGWTFVRTALGEDKVRLVVPNLPSNFKIPPKQQPSVEKLTP